MSARPTAKQLHTNRKNLAKRIRDNKSDRFILEGTKEEIANKFGNVTTNKNGSHIFVKGQLYKIDFTETSAVFHSRPINPFNLD